MLARYLGSNQQPWFLLPLQLSDARRGEITRNFYKKNAAGKHVHSFADGFGGLLSAAEKSAVLEYDDLYFSWQARGPKIMSLVASWEADVISIVENDNFDEFLQELKEHYEGAFVKRPRDCSLDGDSIFWRRDRLELVAPPRNLTLADWSTDAFGRETQDEDRVVLAVALRLIGTEKVIVAASVHLMRNPEDVGKDPMRMLEVSQMMRELTCFMADVGGSGLVIMGDFNAPPRSHTHLFMKHGWQDCAPCDKHIRGAFDAVKWDSDHVCTTKTNARSMWIDYIFYSSSTLELSEDPYMPPCPEGPIPDGCHPSDHLPLVTSLNFRRSADGACSCTVEPGSDEFPITQLAGPVFQDEF